MLLSEKNLYLNIVKGANPRFRYMFKKAETTESTLFESPSNLMRGRALKNTATPRLGIINSMSWLPAALMKTHFKPLFKGNMGPGQHIYPVNLAIMIYEEGIAEATDRCSRAADFDLLVQGWVLSAYPDQAPSLDTYYLCAAAYRNIRR